MPQIQPAMASAGDESAACFCCGNDSISSIGTISRSSRCWIMWAVNRYVLASTAIGETIAMRNTPVAATKQTF